MTAAQTLLRTLIELEERRTRAWLDRDPLALAGLLDEAFTEINAIGRLGPRELIESLYPLVVLERHTMEDACLARLGRNVAVLSYRCDEHLVLCGEEVRGAAHVAATYVRRRGTWRLALWQITPFQMPGE